MINEERDPRLVPWLLLGPVEMPDPTIAPSKKDKEYCNKKARFYANRVSGVHIDWFRVQYGVNASFSRGEWGIEEDRPAFMKDTQKKQYSSRKELSIPLAHPMVMRLCGQAASIEISAKCTSVTQNAATRREAAKDRALAYSIAAQQGGYVMDATMAVTGYGPDEEKSISDTVGADGTGGTYVDQMQRAGNCILTEQERWNDYKYMKDSNANTVACSGMFAAHCRKDGTRLKWTFMHPYEYAWDTASNLPDIADGEFAIHCPLTNLSAVYANAPKAAKDQIDVMQNLAKGESSYTNQTIRGGLVNGKPRRFDVYWREPDWVERGWVMVDGVPTLCAINEPEPNDPEQKPKYTYDDCISLDQLPNRQFTEGWTDKTKKGFMERVYFCSFIPWEYTPLATADRSYEDTTKTPDILLDYGVYDLQEPLCDNPFKVGLPIKFSTVEYIDGYVVAPLTFAISPQRVINQVTSNLVHRMDKAGGQSVWYNDRALADSDQNGTEISYAVKEGDAINIDPSKVGGIQNALGTIDTGLGTGFYNLWQIPGYITNIANTATGMNDPLQGKSTGSQQLVGTTELLLQQSSMMMQPFTNCFVHGFKQMHQFDVQAGKLFYKQYPWALAEMTGDAGLEAIMKSPEMAIEQLRTDIEISVDSTKLMATTDQMIMEFLQLGMLDKVTAAKLGGRSYPSDVWAASRTYTETEMKAMQQRAMQQQKQAQLAVLDAKAQENQRRADETYGKAYDLLGKKMDMDQKSYQPFASQAAKVAMPEPQPAAKPATA